MTSYRESEVKARGVKGTWVSKFGGVGLGYEIDGVVVTSAGNGWYYPQSASPSGLSSFEADGGVGYMNRVRSIGGLPPNYKGVGGVPAKRRKR